MVEIRDTLRERFDDLCREYKEQQGINDSELARRLGYSPQKLYKLRALQLDIRFDDAERIAEFFKVSIAWLCGESQIRQRLSDHQQLAIRQLIEG